MTADTMTASSRQWLEPILSELTERPGVFTHSGRIVLRPVMRLSDGELVHYRTINRDGKGIALGRFVPRVGSVPQGATPSSPVITPRKSTGVPYGTGIAMATATMFEALRVVAEFHVNLIEEFERLRMEEDVAISADVMTAAQAATSMTRAILNQKRLKRKSASTPRVKIHGYSRHV
jgi:hypothetical protein